MTKEKRFYVSISTHEIPSLDDVMCLIGKLSYLDLIELAGKLSADADKMADAYEVWASPSEETEE